MGEEKRVQREIIVSFYSLDALWPTRIMIDRSSVDRCPRGLIILLHRNQKRVDERAARKRSRQT